MTTTQQFLLITLIFTQIILFSSYYYILPQYNYKLFWGNILENDYNYYLKTEFFAYILNIILYLYFIFKDNINNTVIFQVFLTLICYYGLQLYFLPIVLTQNKNYIRLLLGICVLPMAYLFILAYNQTKKNININEKYLLYITSIIPLLHVLFNNYLSYAFKF